MVLCSSDIRNLICKTKYRLKSVKRGFILAGVVSAHSCRRHEGAPPDFNHGRKQPPRTFQPLGSMLSDRDKAELARESATAPGPQVPGARRAGRRRLKIAATMRCRGRHLRVSKYMSKNGPAYRIHHAKASDEQADSDIRMQFCEKVRISKDMRFTKSDIFISPPLVIKHHLEDGQHLSGTAPNAGGQQQ